MRLRFGAPWPSGALLALLLALVAPWPAAPQAGATADTITGTVIMGPDGLIVAGAIVHATSLATRLTRGQSTDAQGRFTIPFPEGGGQYQLVVRYFAMMPARLSVARQARAHRLASTVRMELAGLPNPIDSILRVGDSLQLSAAQAARLGEIADALRAKHLAWSDWYMVQALERARGVLTAYQWAQLSDAGSAPESRAPRFPLASAERAMPQPGAPAPARGALQGAGQPQAARVEPPPWARTSYLYTGLSNVYDNNIEHESVPLNSYGILVGLGGQYEGRFGGTSLELQYDGVFRRYTNTDLWNRPGHIASVSLAQRVTRHWGLGVDGEVSLNGSSEDLVLRNEYSVKSQLDYRFSRTTRFGLYGQYLLKRYPDPLLGQDAVDPRVGFRIRQSRSGGNGWGVTGRYEYNRADSTRHRWAGWTAGADVTNAVWAGGRVSASVRYRIRLYTSRLVTVGITRVLRRDHDTVATLAWEQVLLGLWSVGLSYRFEAYDSNDPDKVFQDHRVGMTVKRWW